MNITMTTAAAEFIKKNIARSNGIGFRLSIKKTGCSGYSYAPVVVDKANPNDISIQSEHGVILFVDPANAALLQGVTIDYVEDVKSGIKQKRLVFTNPNEASRCGCGESFHIAEE